MSRDGERPPTGEIPAAGTSSGGKITPGATVIQPRGTGAPTLDDLFAGVAGDGLGSDSRAVAEEQRHPFKFLDPYGPEDSDIFFGRDLEIAEIYHQLFRSRLLVVYGESGAGKTSLIQCGLRSRIPTEDALFVSVRSARDPLRVLRAELRKLAAPSASGEAPEDIGSLAEGVIERKSKTVVAVFDQLEELFLFQPPAVRERFARELARLLGLELDLRLVLCIREEYLARLTELEQQLPELYQNRLWVRRMSGEQAREAIAKPCAACGVVIEDALIDELVTELAGGGNGVDLPLLQVVLDTLYQRAIHSSNPGEGEPTGKALSASLYEELGQIQSILGGFIEDRVGRYDDPDAMRGVLKALVSPEGTKRISTREEIRVHASSFGVELGVEALDDLLGQLVDDRILREDADTHLLELRHDRLAQTVHTWMTGLEQELVEARASLDNRFKEYQARGQASGAHLDDHFLNYLAPYLVRLRLERSPALARFVRSSQRARTARGRRRRRIVGAVVAVSFAVLGALSVFLWIAWQRSDRSAELAQQRTREAERARILAETERRRARRQAERSKSRALIAEFGRLQAAGRHTEAFALLRATIRREAQLDGARLAKRAGIYRHADTQPLKILISPDKQCTSVAYSPDGRIFATTCKGSNAAGFLAHLWDATSGRHLSVLKHRAVRPRISLRFSRDGRMLATWQPSSEAARIWDTRTGKLRHVLVGHEDISDVVFLPGGKKVITLDSTGTVRTWHVETGRLLRKRAFDPPASFPCSRTVALSPDGRLLFTGHQDGGAPKRLWEARTGRLLHTLPSKKILPSEKIMDRALFSPDGKVLAAIALDGKGLLLWDTGSGQLKHTPSGLGEISALAFSRDGKMLAVGDARGTTCLWEIGRGQRKETVKSGQARVYRLAFSPDGRTLAVASGLSTTLWDVSSGKRLETLRGHYHAGPLVQTKHQITPPSHDFRDIAFSPDGGTLASVGPDRQILIWNLRSQRRLHSLAGLPAGVGRFAPSGRFLASYTPLAARLWDTASGRQVSTLVSSDCPVYKVPRVLTSRPEILRWWTAIVDWICKALPNQTRLLRKIPVSLGEGRRSEVRSHHGQVLAVLYKRKGIHLWDVRSSRRLHVLNVGEAPTIESLRFSPDDRYLLAASMGRTVRVWEVATGRLLHTLRGSADPKQCDVADIRVSPDSRILFTACGHQGILWELASGRRLRSLALPRGLVTDDGSRFSSNGRFLVSSSDMWTSIWHVESGRLLGEVETRFGVIIPGLRATTHGIWQWYGGPMVDISPDGTVIAAAGLDSTVRLWEVRSGSLLLSLRGHTAVVDHIAFSPNGKTLSAVSRDGTTQLWDVSLLPMPELLEKTGARTPFRVCRNSGRVVPVRPAPPPQTVWAPKKSCNPDPAALRTRMRLVVPPRGASGPSKPRAPGMNTFPITRPPSPW